MIRLRRRTADIGERATALGEALDAGGHRLEPASAQRARGLLSKLDERLRLSGEHTVVALAGATGSGKSSLFNALSGLELSTVGARRPTTSHATACVWGADGAEPLLEWLGVPRRHRVNHESALSPDEEADDPLHGLVLLDLPDHDSTEVAHRLEVDRLVELVDVFVWVADPQKYADAALHRQYLSRLAGHDAVTVVVLNQADRLAPEALQACRRDLARLLAADGLRDVEVLTTSARTGEGVDRLRDTLAEAVGRRTAWSERLGADLDAAAVDLGGWVGESEPDPGQVASAPETRDLVEAFADAAGVPAVVRAVEADYRRDALGTAGWPVTRWGRRLRPDPLRRLGLPGNPGGGGRRSTPDKGRSDGELEAADVARRSSLPAASATQRARVELATRRISDRAGADLPQRWADAVRAAAQPPADDLTDALDQAVVRTDLGLRRPVVWRFLGLVQTLLLVAAVVGLGWLVALAALGWLKLPQPTTPYWGPMPVPTLMLVGGLLLGLLLGGLVRIAAGAGARRRGARVRSRLHDAVGEVAQERVLDPVGAVLADHRAAREALRRAAGGRR
jgi:GTP-binding protein EngB required for normal cell division